MPPIQYNVVTPGTPHNLPNRPAVPYYHGLNGDARNTTKEAYKEQQCIFSEAHLMHNQIKKLLINAILKIYIKVLADDLQGFAMVTAGAIFAHVVTTYGKITNANLDHNLQELGKPWDPATPIVLRPVRHCWRQEHCTKHDDANPHQRPHPKPTLHHCHP